MMSRILALDCLQLCSCRGQPSPGQPEVPSQEQEPPPAYTPPEVGPGDQGQEEQQEGSGVSLSNTSLNDIRSAQQSLLDEMVELKSSLKYSKKLSETTIGSIRGMRAEVKDMRDLCRETISESRQTMRQRLMMPPHPTPVGRVYPRVPAPTENSEYLQEFSTNCCLVTKRCQPVSNTVVIPVSHLRVSASTFSKNRVHFLCSLSRARTQYLMFKPIL